MSTIIATGAPIAEGKYAALEKRVSVLLENGIQPKLMIFSVGDVAASKRYIQQKQKAAERLGVLCSVQHFPATVTTADLAAAIQQIIRDDGGHGAIIQLPLPASVKSQDVLDVVPEDMDIDVLSSASQGRLLTGESRFLPPTAQAVLDYLEHYQILHSGKHVVLVGYGALVGRPLVSLLLQRGATVTITTALTTDLGSHTRTADIIITGAGQPRLITRDMTSAGVICIDAGFTVTEDGIAGDCDVASLTGHADLITPTPGGVGVLTVVNLFANLISAAELRLDQAA